jgi:hypothetical protein
VIRRSKIRRAHPLIAVPLQLMACSRIRRCGARASGDLAPTRNLIPDISICGSVASEVQFVAAADFVCLECSFAHAAAVDVCVVFGGEEVGAGVVCLVGGASEDHWA